MRKTLIIAISFMILFMSAGCFNSSYPKTDLQIKEDCLKIQPIQSNLVELKGFKINSKKVETSSFIVNATISLITDKETVQAEVLMNYKKHEKIWYVDTTEIKILEVLTTIIPTIDSVKQKLMNYPLLLDVYEAFDLHAPLSISHQIYTNKGRMDFTYTKQGHHELFSYETNGKVTAIYDLNKRWQLKVSNDYYAETTVWSGEYELIKGTLKDFVYVITQRIPLSLTGDCKMTGNGISEATECNVFGYFTINGKDYRIEGIRDPQVEHPNTRNLIFKYGAADDQYLGVKIFFIDDYGSITYVFAGIINDEIADLIRLD
jgi:hypothetical protein